MGNKHLRLGLPCGLLLLIAAPALAQGEVAVPGASGPSQWLMITSRFSMALAAAGCAYAQGRAITAACESVSRNPGATDTIRIFAFLGLAMIEFLALLTMVVIMMKW
jgi:F-type H+-transporting ATPase subunit c